MIKSIQKYLSKTKQNADSLSEFRGLNDSLFYGKAVALKDADYLESYCIVFGPTKNEAIFNAWTAMNFRPETMIKVSVYSA